MLKVSFLIFGITYFFGLIFSSLRIFIVLISESLKHSFNVNFPLADPAASKCVEIFFLPGVKAKILLSHSGLTPVWQLI